MRNCAPFIAAYVMSVRLVLARASVLVLPPHVSDGMCYTCITRGEALLTHLDNLEDIYIAEKRLENLRAGRSYTIPLEEVMKEHGNLES
jgi:predicted DNA-binding protein